MSDGIKAMYEEIEEQEHRAKVAKLDVYPTSKLVVRLEDALDTLQRIHKDSTIQLSRTNWGRLETVIESLDKILKGEK
jgi:hypothetical protein